MASRSRALLPALRAGVAVIPMDGGVQLRIGDEEVHVLRTDAPEELRQVLILLDGRRHREGLLAEVARAHEFLDELLAELGRAGLLSPAPAEAADEAAAYLSHFASELHDPAADLRRARVVVTGPSKGLGLLLGILREHGVEANAMTGEPRKGLADVMVCLCEQPDLARLFEVNDAACVAGLPCLFVDLSHGRHATVGPFHVPGDGACYRCLRTRLHENTAAFPELRAAEQQMLETGKPLPAFGCLPAHRHVVLGLAASEIVAFFTRHRPLRTLNRAITVALEQARMWSEPVWRVPWCSACGSAQKPG
jgi:oxazoline/thiazoline synthase